MVTICINEHFNVSPSDESLKYVVGMFSCLELVSLFWILTVDGMTTSAQHLTARKEGKISIL